MFTGENIKIEDKGFDKWFELFEECAQFAGWKPEQKLCRLKVHLDKTAQQIVKIMLDLSSIRGHKEMTQLNSWVWNCKHWAGEHFHLLVLWNLTAC